MTLAAESNAPTNQGCPFPGATAPTVPAGRPPHESAASGSDVTHLTVHYDPLSYAAYDHPYDLYRRLRDEAPVYYNADRNLYVISRYDDVQAGLKNYEQMINAFGNDVDGTHDSYGSGNLVAQDPPRHTALRASVRRVFAAREILAKEDGMREFSQNLLAQMHENGGGDFTAEFALPLAIAAATNLVGMPAEDNAMLQDHLWRAMQRTVGEFGVPDDAAASNQETELHIHEVVEQRRHDIEAGADTASSDAITQILLGVAKGKVEQEEQVGLSHLILSAAIDAPAALITNCIAVLDKFPALQQHLRDHPELIGAFVEETLRYDTPGQNLSRQTTSEVVIGGVTIPADSRVMLLLGSANRDERVFENPDAFDLSRAFTPKNRIMSFGDGIHACMGSPLARLATRVAMETLLAGPSVRIVGTPERWVKQMVRGFAVLPVKFS
ncbi:hypothetical protein GY21_10425 [Cryobacterium roopkundense]|uniref:Cytochrome P450 n=1 Tax=Cryobacterium roopkundense TaxID=1001240 RepID=A0A099J7S6_9MICO|nr:cytochrome P450 [Cryobacterium roopkundense]KGJ74454.1 hypothetical protein GY21_10425 [Cryobacterium roopkundense]MBB5643434.1 hypothetical protein [Cryobacterium roopkundense]